MSTVVRWGFAAALIALLAGCDAKSNDEKRDDAALDPTPDSGDLGFVHAISDAPSVTVAFAGSNAHRIDKIISVKELITSLTKEYEQVSYTEQIKKKISIKVA